jgi:hypothetical protein
LATCNNMTLLSRTTEFFSGFKYLGVEATASFRIYFFFSSTEIVS